MKRRIHLIGFLTVSLALGACASTSTGPVTEAYSPAAQSFVATRAFGLRSAPSLGAPDVARIEAGAAFEGAERPATQTEWRYLMVTDGPSGYVFGAPYIVSDNFIE